MKTHPESVWIDTESLRQVDEYGMQVSAVSSEQILANDLEFVPASAYIELKNELESSNKRTLEAVSVATDTLKDLSAYHAEFERLNAQLQTQTENMRALREFVEMVANSSHFEELPGDIICQAQDLIGTLK